jgi:hypothetical protein
MVIKKYIIDIILNNNNNNNNNNRSFRFELWFMETVHFLVSNK